MLVTLVGAALAWATTGPLRWLATAAVLTTAPVLLGRLVRSPWWQQRQARLPATLLVLLCVVLLGPLLRGEPPASRDHGIHYFQIRMLVEELLPSGRLWGWSETLNYGYPYGESYPVLGYLWMAAAHLLSFGLISLRTSYALGLAALWIVSALVVWRLAAAVTREFGSLDSTSEAEPSTRVRTIAAWAGLVGAAAWLLDPGASRQGGWNYLMFHGVWPQLLAATLWAASLGLTWRAMAEPTPRRLGAATLVLGASLWAHPFALLTAAISAAAFLVAPIAIPRAQRWPTPWRSWALVHIGAALLGGAWLAAFFASAESMARAPVPWTPLAELGQRVAHGQLVAGQWAWVGPLAAIGGLAIARRQGAKGWLVLGVAVVILVLASEEAITVLRLDLVVSGFKNLQFPRYAIPLKPVWFSLAGIGVGAIVLRLPAARARPTSPLGARGWVPRAAVGLLLAPLVASLAPELGRLLPRPVAAIDTLGEVELAESEAELVQTLRAEADALAPGQPLVVAMMRDQMTGTTYPIASVADAGGRLVLDSHIPTVNFKHRFRRNPHAYAALGVTHVLHDREVPEDEPQLTASLTEIERFGPFWLERLIAPPGRDLADPPRYRLSTTARAEVVVDEAERMVLTISGVTRPASLILMRAPHTRWRLSLDGEPLEIEERAVERGAIVAMATTIEHDGEVVLHYERSDRERIAGWMSVLALLACAASLLSARPLGREPPTERARLVATVVIVVALLAVAFLVHRRQVKKLDETWRELAVDQLRPGDGESDEPAVPPEEDDDAPRLVRDLVIDQALTLERQPEVVCSGLLGKNVLEGCSEAAHAPSQSFLYRAPYLYRCQRFSLPPRGHMDITPPAPLADGNVVVGAVIRHVRPGTGKAVRWGIGNKGRGGLRNRRHDFVLEPSAKKTMPSLRFRNDGNAIEQVCVALAEVEP